MPQWWVGFEDDSELFILFAENSQIFLKISVIPILLTFIYLVALNLLVSNQLNSIIQLNSSVTHIIVTLICQFTNYDCDNYVPQWWVEFDNELSWLFTNRFSATRYMKVKRMEITEILRKIWLFSANKIKSSESVNNQLKSSSNATHHCGRN